jgi:hypothetical protein
MISVGKIENGFLIELRVPFKPKETDGDDGPTVCGFDRNEKEIFAKDASELGKKIEALIPLLDVEFGSESEFEVAFRMTKA